MTYRFDIEGLRAIAVLLVVIFHINENLITGGFVGVDLFFVISGYVITQRIYKDGINRPSDFLEFYRRRIRRITPVMLFVTAVTLIAGAFILLPDDLVDLSWSAIAAAFSASNIYFTFFLDTSYFANDSHYIPLLHLWSLGVEEQFYLFWPMLLFFLMKWPRAILPTLAFIMVVSVAWGEYWIRDDNFTAAYYMLPSRAFQLCAGGFCLFAAQTRIVKDTSPTLLFVLGVTGLILVIGSAYMLTSQMAFPGRNAIPVTLGAALLLIAGTKVQPLSRFLSIWPARQIGNISYSMYLWHWPLLAYLRYTYVEINLANGVLVFVAIIALSVLSTRFIEAPFRHTKMPFWPVFNRMLAAPVAVLVAACIGAISLKGFVPLASPDGYEEKLEALTEQTKAAYNYDYVCQGAKLTKEFAERGSCLINGGASPKYLLWGDSNAAHYIGVFGELAKKYDFSFRNIEHSSCPPLLEGAANFAAAKNKKGCAMSAPIISEMLNEYDRIIVAASYMGYQNFSERFQDGLLKTLKALRERGMEVIIVGQAARFNGYDRNCAAKAIKLGFDCATQFTSNTGVAKVNKKIREIASQVPGVKYVDFNDVICPNGICSPYNNGRPMYFDGGHLSMSGSWIIGKEAVALRDYRYLFQAQAVLQ
ncbi:acyltransferase family protein [Mesorhizobium sp. KR1-2]|uniref:acyltransferase family protein n=1 Tax=Mesorhizobium sp. KR1-2 TaxID=3156609 RepID=UPI0032B5698E